MVERAARRQKAMAAQVLVALLLLPAASGFTPGRPGGPPRVVHRGATHLSRSPFGSANRGNPLFAEEKAAGPPGR